MEPDMPSIANEQLPGFAAALIGVWGAMEPKTNVRKISTHFIE